MPPKSAKVQKAAQESEAKEPKETVETVEATPTAKSPAKKTKAPAKPRQPKVPKSKTSDESNSSSDDAETKKPTEKKLSAVPMPLVKKVKEQLGTEVNLKNVNELKTILETFIEVIVDTVSKGDSVTLPNVMTFKRVLRKERTHMNPRTHMNKVMESIVKPAHYVFSMYVKARLKKDFETIEVCPADLEPKPKVSKKKDQPPATEEETVSA